MYSPQKQLSELATKRLKSIKEFTQLGTGTQLFDFFLMFNTEALFLIND